MKLSLALLGWAAVIAGAAADAVYHIPNWFFGVQWGPEIDAIGEFGHTVIFAGIVVLIFDILRRHQRAG
jgi:hypothetical protein